MKTAYRLKPLLLCVVFFALLINAVALIIFLFSNPRAPEANPESQAMGSTPAATTPKLAYANLPSAAHTGSCLAWDGFTRGELGFEQAKALLLSGPLRAKSWALQSGGAARWRVLARPTPELAEILGKIRFPSPEGKSEGDFMWDYDTEQEAKEALQELKTGGAQASIVKTASTAPERRIAILPQGPNEIAYARSLIERLPGSGLSAVACPELASAALAAGR